ncbi:MAG: hypothetical protein IRY99_15300 [Isosphaeraceae bacterium]|nr:hypothetical protein [Isosphaeraceae bacterium]
MALSSAKVALGPEAEDERCGGLSWSSEPRWVERATWAFVGLGLLVRLAKYLMNYPLWWDEAFVAVNFIHRGYRELLGPLDCGQICPPLFLVIELTIVRALGFSELTLRLFPLLCALTSVVLFRYAAGLLLRGVPRWLAVAIFAVSFHPIRHAAEVKPYASDLLVALGLLTLAFWWLREPARALPLWALAGAVPVALGLSYPAVFVAGGIGLGLAPKVWRMGRRDLWLAFSAIGLALVSTFGGLIVTFARSQSSTFLAGLQSYWASSFPPLDSAWTFGKWLIATHTGTMFAYPGGGQRGGSAATLALVVLAAIALWRRDRRTILAICLAPFALTLAAATWRRYPYGGEARIVQHLAPSICLLSGLGAALVLARMPQEALRQRALIVFAAVLAGIGLGPLGLDLYRPYRFYYAHRAREFARRFWPEQARKAELACLRWDYGIIERGKLCVNTPVFLCNQMIYSPPRYANRGPRRPEPTSSRPLHCILYDETSPDHPDVVAWLKQMTSRYDLKDRTTLLVNMARPDQRPRWERVTIFAFELRRGRSNTRVATPAGRALAR